MHKNRMTVTVTTLMLLTMIYGSYDVNIYAANNNEIRMESVQYNYTVKVSKATVRKSASNSSSRLGTIKKGTSVSVIQEGATWTKINYNKTTGYVKTNELNKEIIEPVIVEGSINIKYIDSVTNTEIAEAQLYNDLELGEYTYTAKDIEGYTIIGDAKKSTTITTTNPNETINFMYKEVDVIPDKENDNSTTEDEPNVEITDNTFLSSQKGLFSWKKEQTTQDMREDTLFWLEKFKINELYQSGLFRIEEDVLTGFVKDLNSKGVDVYNLTGEPDWFNKVDSFKKRIDQVKNYNASSNKDSKIKGVVFDVEPWCLGDGNWTQAEFAATVKEAYSYAQTSEVEMVMVIPFWLEPEISEIIIANSDKTIVMNYNINNPVKFIQEEIETAKKYNKKISTAAETMKSNDEYGVDSTTTYYYAGADRLSSDWKAMYDKYQYEGLEFSLHDMTNIKAFYEQYKESIDKIWDTTKATTKSKPVKGIFSWSTEQTSSENREDTLNWANKLELNEIYQSGLFRVSSEQLSGFTKDLNIKGIDVYNLTGEPTWFNKVDSFKKRIDQVRNHNESSNADSRIKGVVFDVEPWCLGEGNWTQEEFASTVKEAYSYAQKSGVEMVMVIPFWLEPGISEIIIANSDKTIVMNYNIKNPIKFIQEEIELAKKYNKKISTAAETMKSNDEYGVDSTTTYYYVGEDRLKSDWQAIYNEYQYEGLEFSLHDLKNVKLFFN